LASKAGCWGLFIFGVGDLMKKRVVIFLSDRRGAGKS
jgi:hypothetical protein